MYIFIFEDGQAKKSNSVADDDLAAVDSGLLQVIKVTGDEAMEYYNGEWSEIEQV